ncbi:SGNH/GDSL hydrolase family protein [Pararhizobium antarcticum]|uniref:SGNH hydrolase-type esterase domain-containing protein n=1 Tax=Pararhizobium antarcticum TaxID=1798805 RepID=A0A657LU74_9HYPH|nr:DUF459 domain-containing protein [Pararhizobium antarcticum]OJF94505.1 hypothetical protein AX760_19840 [Pararhizobium antarcticum]OJF96645.1 hypothetical protein AX761_03520 [Rhizobium sp. 58]
MTSATTNHRRFPWLLRGLLTVCLAASVIAVQPVTSVQAQERVERRTIMQMLFGRAPRQERRDFRIYDEEPVIRRQQQQQRQQPQKTRQKAKPQPAVAAPLVVEKLPEAKTVLVVGDFIAGSLGDGLKTAFEATPGIVIETRANGSSGMVRDDYFNWPAILPGYEAELKPSLIIVSLGANDRQQISIGRQKEKFRTEEWLAEYTRRVSAFATLARTGNVPMLWVGMPPFQSGSMTADMVTLNGIFRVEAEKAGGEFIDIWDGFVDESGKFVLTGSDINGQQVRLRGSDGINLTKAGKRKLAFYVEKDIRRLLGDAAASGSDVLGAGDLKDLVVTAPVEDQLIVKTQPISLADPALDGGSALMGGPILSKTAGKSPRDLLVEKGELAEAPTGRIDDFRLAKPETVISNPVIRN